MAFHNIKPHVWCCLGSSTWAQTPVVYTRCGLNWCHKDQDNHQNKPSKFMMCQSGCGIICYTEITDYRPESYTWIILRSALPISWAFFLCFGWVIHHFSFAFFSLYSDFPRELFSLSMDLTISSSFSLLMSDQYIPPPCLHYALSSYLLNNCFYLNYSMIWKSWSPGSFESQSLMEFSLSIHCFRELVS